MEKGKAYEVPVKWDVSRHGRNSGGQGERLREICRERYGDIERETEREIEKERERDLKLWTSS